METFSCTLRVRYGPSGEKLCNCSLCASCMDCVRKPESNESVVAE